MAGGVQYGYIDLQQGMEKGGNEWLHVWCFVLCVCVACEMVVVGGRRMRWGKGRGKKWRFC